ncbi:hypothetical protein KK062_24075 [Fulvivirgaceae bacterium PWU5]|uniref:Uncharacterized protein n=1 Tax=Dawidia cretensis TaxID=2782350 RepID=A0AAP2GS51_9BACT|nr:hypothetical protein [Dawidia cretensis]MBT1711341.1 hypothetical protein [Dawidia cretensis]
MQKRLSITSTRCSTSSTPPRATQLTRFRKDGSKLGVYESLYVLTKEDGRWGVKLRSSYAE